MSRELLLSLLAGLLLVELVDWLPKITRCILAFATRRLPKSKRSRYQEEWTAHVNDTPGVIWKLVAAIGFVIASGRMYPRYNRQLRYLRKQRVGSATSRLSIRAMDVIVSGSVVLAFAPLLVSLCAAIWLIDGGPVFTVRRTLGHQGKFIRIMKFRTTRVQPGAAPTNEAPEMIPWIGRFMRRSALEELPMLLAVFRGDLSMVGPPPWMETEEFRDLLRREGRFDGNLLVVARQRFMHKPGLTRELVVYSEEIAVGPETSPRKALSRYVRGLLRAVRSVIH